MVDDVQKLEQKQPVALRIPVVASIALAAIAVLPVARDRFGEEVEEHLLDVAHHAAEDRSAWSAVDRPPL